MKDVIHCTMKKFVLLPSENYERLLQNINNSVTSSSKDIEPKEIISNNSLDIVNDSNKGDDSLKKDNSKESFYIKLVPPPGEPEDSFYI